MDRRTQEVYEDQAEEIFARHVTIGRKRHSAWMLAHLLPGEPTADIGSGSGIGLEWLKSQGFPAVGYEPARALRELSLDSFPGITVMDAALPDLAGIADNSFGNVVCSAVLMHLPLDSIFGSFVNLARILRPGGRLVLTFRTSNNQRDREDDGRLFTPISTELVDTSLRDADLELISRETNEDPSRPGIIWTSVAAEKTANASVTITR